MRPVLEVPIESVEGAVASMPFADRLEVCDDLSTEGWTPTPDLVRAVRGAMDEAGRPGARVVAMIRPRVPAAVVAPVLEAFVATPVVIEACLREIESMARVGAHDVAIGLLRSDASIDVEAMERLAGPARALGLGVAFLRTLDLVRDRDRAMRDLVELGMERVVTAGVFGWDASVATVGSRADRLMRDAQVAEAHAAARGLRCVTIVPGGGVRSSNAREFMRVSSDVHSSCRVGGVLDAAEGRALRAVLDGMT
jgi:copper homeostasis protein